MPDLPASARLSLWATSYLAGLTELEAALAHTAPDADHHEGAGSWLTARRSLGERVLLVALPRPGDPTDLPGGSALQAAALDAGECVFAPGLGGALVPEVAEYGPVGDQGLAVRWSAFDSDPVAAYVLDGWSARDAERDVRSAVASATEALANSPSPWLSRGLADQAQGLLDGQRWGLPLGLNPTAVRVIALAGTVIELTSLALESPQDGTSAGAIETRRQVLSELQRAAERALSRSVNAGALHLAGLRPGRTE